MKKTLLFILMICFWFAPKAQLTIYSDYNLTGSSANCIARIIYSGNNIPNGLNDQIKSISLAYGYMATFADSVNGSGERFTYMANKSAIKVNLSLPLQNKVSFIRVLKLPTTKVRKKGVCSTNNTEIDSIQNTTWFYDWNDKDQSTPSREYAPMAFMWYSTRDSSITKLINKDSITHYIAFNEPDVTGPSRMFVSQAIPAYKNMLKAGLRMGSPSASYRIWQDTFARVAKAQKLGIDYVCVHWYDWGAYMTTHPDSIVSAAGILSRFKSFLEAVYDYYRKPIWITEFNANIHRTDSVHHEFMKIALPWLDSCRFVERYAYFFGNDIRSINPNGTLTEAGLIYKNHASVDAYPENIIDTRPSLPTSLVSWQSSAVIQGGLNQPLFTATKINTNLTAPVAITRGSGVGIPPSSSSNGYWGGTNFSNTTVDDAISNNKFLTFNLQSKNGKSINLHSISKTNIRIGSTGPIQFRIDYKVDDGRFFTVDTISGPLRITGNYTLDSIDLSSISNLQNIPHTSIITFRIIPFNATGTGSFLIGSGINDTLPDFEINGGYSDENFVATTLPVSLLNFQLKQLTNNNLLLQWSTNSENNFSHFEIERSNDGEKFHSIAIIYSKNQSNINNYHYTDFSAKNKVLYYRLKVIDKDGSYTYSNILKNINFSINKNLLVSPTIASSNFIKTSFEKTEKQARLMVIDASGKVLITYTIPIGTSNQNIETKSLINGTYFLILQSVNSIQSAKFIKQ